MQYDFLKNFPKRMKNVGLYSLLVQNSFQKTTWKQYGFIKSHEQINMIFAVLLYIMEQSLKEENCTLDDIGAYIDTLNMQYLRKNISYEECKELGDFIVNTILCNEGRPMYFEGFDFEQGAYQRMNVSYVANRVVYIDGEIKRTSYYLTDDGYSLLLSTLEVESNMKLTIHEMIFQMHLEKQSYDKAVDEIKNVFNLLRIQLQKIQEAMSRIRRNALNYSVKDYEEILVENLNTISDTKEKFQNYREMVKKRVHELEEENINVQKLSRKDEENLNHLRIIETYLNRTIDEHQKILNHHFDLKALYTHELEQLSQMALIQRFQLRTDFYEKVLENPGALEQMDYFFRPLFNQDGEKIYNLNKAFQYQKMAQRKQEEDETEELDFDEETWQREQEERKREKLKKYEGSLSCILKWAGEKGEVSLGEMKEIFDAGEEEEKLKFIPTVEIFKEIMVELMKTRRIDLPALREEQKQFIQEESLEFRLGDMVLKLADEIPENFGIEHIETYRLEREEPVVFEGVFSEDGSVKSIRCSDVLIRVRKKV